MIAKSNIILTLLVCHLTLVAIAYFAISITVTTVIG
jgi:hypothetical protein